MGHACIACLEEGLKIPAVAVTVVIPMESASTLPGCV